MEHKWLPPKELQRINEFQFNRKHIDGYIRKEIFEGTENLLTEVEQGVELLKQWMGESYYPSKDARLYHLSQLDLEKLVKEIFVGVMYFQLETPFVNAIGQLASRIGFDDKRDSVQTIAEILALLAETDVFDLVKHHRNSPIQIICNIQFSEQLSNFIAYSCYLPPLVCEPRKLINNRSTAYYTHKNDSLILGGGFNHHDGNICLDVLNSRNSVPLSLDVEFLCTVEEEPTHDLDSIESDEDLSDWQIADMVRKQKENWASYKEQSYYFYSLMVNQGNRFYISNKVDKRGRMYACGYHITPQGTSFKKAMINLADKEPVMGVPDKFRK